MKKFKGLWDFWRNGKDGDTYKGEIWIPVVVIIGLFVAAFYWYETHRP